MGIQPESVVKIRPDNGRYCNKLFLFTLNYRYVSLYHVHCTVDYSISPLKRLYIALLVSGSSLKYHKGAFTYDVSSRGGRGFEMLTVADKGGEGV